jgi:acetylornithine deacetylase/succinyl-diaminopimelate desuccinylase-like protein
MAMTLQLDWDAIQDEAVVFLKDLLRLDTTNPPGNEGPAIAYLRERLEAAGLAPVVVEGAPGRPSLVVRIPGRGKGPSLLLDSHVDVVPAEAREWTLPPFAAQERDGHIYGRGALDMKQMTAMSLAVVLTVARNDIALAGDLVMSAVADEEGGANLGAFHLVKHHPDLIRTDYALGEVGGMNMTIEGRRLYPVQVAEKGICWLKLTVKGEGGHGSMPRRGRSAARNIARVVEILDELRFPITPHPAAAGFLEAMAQLSGTSQAAALRLVARGLGSRAILDRLVPAAKRPGLEAILAHTCQPTVVAAGSKINVLPTSGTVLADCRILPGTSPEEMTAAVEKAVGNLATVELVNGHRGHATSTDNPLYRQIIRTVSVMDPGALVSPYLMPGFTNGGAYSQLGTKYMGFTPVMLPATIDFSALFHAPDERIPIEGFRWGVRTLFDVVYQFMRV